MTGDTPSDQDDQESNRDTDEVELAASSDYKILGDFADDTGAAVRGRNTAGSGTPKGVQGIVPNSFDGYGLATPDDAQILGNINTQVLYSLEISGTDAFQIGPINTDGDGDTAGANVVGGHPDNYLYSDVAGATIAGGGSEVSRNDVGANYGTVGGGVGNTAGNPNTGSTGATYATVGGGLNNNAYGESSTIGGGSANANEGFFGTIAGGNFNEVTGKFGLVGGGSSSEAHGESSTIGGGEDNRVGTSGKSEGLQAMIGGGKENVALGDRATIGGGRFNEAHGPDSTVGGGVSNTAGKSGTSKGDNATIPGGANNAATGRFSYAAGRYAEAAHDGTYVWADDAFDIHSSTSSNQYLIRARGGVGIRTNAPKTQFHVTDQFSNTARDNPGNNVALFENTSSNDSPNVLGLQAGSGPPGGSTNYVTFYANNGDSVGAIQGDGSSGVTYKNTGADVAEYFPKADPHAEFAPGDVVGLENGQTTRDPTDADAAMVVSTAPMVLGNDPGDDEEYVEGTLLGQVPVTVDGPVQAGDLLVADEGHAVAREHSDREDPPLVGLALEDHEGDGEVRALIGGPTHGPAATLGPDETTIEDLRADARERDERIADLERELERKDERIATLASELDAVRERLSALETGRSTPEVTTDD